MTEKTEPVRKTTRQAATIERGINLDVLGRAIIAQADERIRWHKRTAAAMEAELKAIKAQTRTDVIPADDWKRDARKTELESKIGAHLEYARFLTFVRQNILRDRRYRLGLPDLSLLELMPKGRYF